MQDLLQDARMHRRILVGIQRIDEVAPSAGRPSKEVMNAGTGVKNEIPLEEELRAERALKNNVLLDAA
jgi:hypothetical protein